MTTSRDQLRRTDIERMVQRIDPDWAVQSIDRTTGNSHHVARLRVDTPDGTDAAVLKASAEDRPTVGLETRLLGLLDAHTDVPVPTIRGVVDDHPDLPSPFFLMEAMPGRSCHRTDLDTLNEATIEGIARSSGRHLAALHDLDVVETYGYLECPSAGELDGEAPAGVDRDVAVIDGDPGQSWSEYLETYNEQVLRQVAETQDADVVPDVRPVLEDAIDELTGQFRPVLAHVDNSLENLLFDDDGEVTAMLDWEFTIAATPDYDLVCVDWSLAGGPYLLVPDAPDYQSLIRETLLEGYRAGGGSQQVIEQVRANRDLYELYWHLRMCVLAEMWLEMNGLDEDVEDALATNRATIESYL